MHAWAYSGSLNPFPPPLPIVLPKLTIFFLVFFLEQEQLHLFCSPCRHWSSGGQEILPSTTSVCQQRFLRLPNPGILYDPEKLMGVRVDKFPSGFGAISLIELLHGAIRMLSYERAHLSSLFPAQ